MTDKVMVCLIKQKHEQGKDDNQIAKEVGLSRFTVYNIRKTYKIGTKQYSDSRTIKKKAIALAEEGYTNSEIARELGKSYQYIHSLLKEALDEGILSRQVRNYKNRNKKTTAKAEKELFHDGLTRTHDKPIIFKTRGITAHEGKLVECDMWDITDCFMGHGIGSYN